MEISFQKKALASTDTDAGIKPISAPAGKRVLCRQDLILLCNLWACLDDVAVAVRLHEVTVGNLGQDGVAADENIDSVTMLPQGSHNHLMQAAWLTKDVQDLFCNQGMQHLTLVLLQAFFRLTFLCHGHP